MALYLKKDREGIAEVYGVLTDLLLSNEFLFPYDIDRECIISIVFSLDHANDVLSAWLALPEILHLVSQDRLQSIVSFFYPIVSTTLRCICSHLVLCSCCAVPNNGGSAAVHLCLHCDCEEYESPPAEPNSSFRRNQAMGRS